MGDENIVMGDGKQQIQTAPRSLDQESDCSLTKFFTNEQWLRETVIGATFMGLLSKFWV